jgi:flavin-dependent dehydrogenase
MGTNSQATVFGGGMSGLIAALNLAKEGYDVLVREKQSGFGGSRIYNPSTHVTPIDPVESSRYIGIDIKPAFHEVNTIAFYMPGVRFTIPTEGFYAVERGDRVSSLDTLLYEECRKAGVSFEFDSPLTPTELEDLPPNSIIACGLTPSAYKMLDVPYHRWYGWITRGDIGLSDYAWTWWDDCITEYGYFSSVNNYFFDLLFSSREVSRESLDKYKRFRLRNEGMEHDDWEYVSGVVPIAEPNNPRLFWKGAILSGTISGAMDPLFWFGISGALVTGRVAAMAVTDPGRALADFERFTRRFRLTYYFKKKLWYPFIRPNVRQAARRAGALTTDEIQRRTERAASTNVPRYLTAIPGFGRFNCSL